MERQTGKVSLKAGNFLVTKDVMRIFVLFLLTSFFTLGASAQHMSFAGVSMNNTVANFNKLLLKKGFKHNSGVPYYQGYYMGYPVCVEANGTDITHKVYSVNVFFQKTPADMLDFDHAEARLRRVLQKYQEWFPTLQFNPRTDSNGGVFEEVSAEIWKEDKNSYDYLAGIADFGIYNDASKYVVFYYIIDAKNYELYQKEMY